MISEDQREFIRFKVAVVRQQMKKAQEFSTAGQKVTLIAVTKRREPEVLPVLAEQGVTDVAENRVQELVKKRAYWNTLPSQERRVEHDFFRWHLIGTLQKNKVKLAVSYADVIHSVDSAALYHAIVAEAKKQKKHVAIFLQVNSSGEESKHGFTVQEVSDFYLALREPSPYVELIGLMTMAPKEASIEELHALFAGMKTLKEDLNPTWHLSMGMSNDYLPAIEEGATYVRLGRILFE